MHVYYLPPYDLVDHILFDIGSAGHLAVNRGQVNNIKLKVLSKHITSKSVMYRGIMLP
jgi:hypothetical protein